MCVFSISLVIDYVCVSLSFFHLENEIDMSFICFFFWFVCFLFVLDRLW